MAIVVAAAVDGHTDRGGRVGGVPVTWHPTITVYEAIVGGLDPGGGAGEAAHPRAVDQLLALEDATKQQSDDDQHDCGLDQSEARLLIVQVESPLARLNT